ncbi:hypothetical protein [Xylella fastidiosa]|uniref:hypothetical protein n=1 Tax=Xylella fastidiosa TaxID=2371 RepID=UPI003984EFEE
MWQPRIAHQEELAEVRRASDTDNGTETNSSRARVWRPCPSRIPVDQAAIARQAYDDSPGINALHRRWRGNEPHRARPPAADYR